MKTNGPVSIVCLLIVTEFYFSDRALIYLQKIKTQICIKFINHCS